MLLSHLFPSLTSQIIGLVLLLWFVREVRLQIREFLIGRRARARGARLAPRAYSSLPFGLSFVFLRLRSLASGTPSDVIKNFYKIPGLHGRAQVIRTRHFGMEMIQSLSHQDARYMLTTNFDNWGKLPDFIDSFQYFLGEGVFSSDQRGLWSWHRSLTRPHFTRDRVSEMHACEEHIPRVITWLEKRSEAVEAVDIQDVFSRFTLTCGSQHLFGKCLDMLNDLLHDRPVKECLIDPAVFSQGLADALKDGLKFMLLPSFLRRSIQAFLMPNKAIKSVFEVVDSLIAEKEKSDVTKHLAEDQDEQDLLDHLRRSGCSAELVRFELLNILIAARDTTSSLLTSCIYELAGRDELWNQLRTEVAELDKFTCITLEQVSHLKLLRAVINETLRLHPPIWFNFRHAFKDDVLPSGIFVPAGSDVQFYIREFHRDPKIWGEDAEVFLPERWLDKTKQNKESFTFQPFSTGPRICIGQQFAYTEVSVTLVRLLLAFTKVELVGPSASRENFQEIPSVVISVRGGLWVRFHKIDAQ